MDEAIRIIERIRRSVKIDGVPLTTHDAADTIQLIEQLQKENAELRRALELSGNANGIAATLLDFHGRPSHQLDNAVELMENHEKNALKLLTKLSDPGYSAV